MRLVVAIILLLCISTMAKYDPEIALNMVYASGLAYWDAKDILASKCNNATTLTEAAGMKVLHAKNSGEESHEITYVILEWAEKNSFIVGFSGTRGTLQFILQVLDLFPVEYSIHPEIKGAKVFNYYYENYVDGFKDDFFEVMESLYSQTKYSSYGIIFTGHSLGGVMATHAVADFVLSEIGKKNSIKDMAKSTSKPYVQIYTFGQLRVGNYAFIEPVQAKIDEAYRIVHNRDYIAHFPLWVPNLKGGCARNGIFTSYPYHFAQEILYEKSSENYKECSLTDGEDPKCSNGQINYSYDDHLYYLGIRIYFLHMPESE